MNRPKYINPIKWRCKKCGSEQVSDPLRRHRMDWCRCSRIGVDLEQEYMRIVGEEEYYEELENDN